MKNLVNSFNILSNIINGSFKFILSYGDSKNDKLPIGLYEFYGIETSDKKCHKITKGTKEKYVFDYNEHGFDLNDIKEMYEYLYGIDVDINGLLEKEKYLKLFDLNDRLIFDGRAGKITIPIIKVIEMFSTKNILENDDIIFEYAEPQDMNYEREDEIQQKAMIINAKPVHFSKKLNAFSFEESDAESDELEGTNFTIIPIPVKGQFDIKNGDSKLQKLIEEANKEKAEESYEEYEEKSERAARYRHGNNDEKYRDREKAIKKYNANRANVAKKKQRKAKKKEQA